MNFDYAQAFLWTLTYIIIAFTAYINESEKQLTIPPFAILTNFSWESASIIFSLREGFNIFSQGHFIRFTWFLSDIFILWFFFHKNDFFKKKKLPLVGYITVYLILTAFFFCLFNSTERGMLLSSFCILVVMEALFWLHRKNLDPCNRLTISITKMLGDFFAGIYYGSANPTVIVLACIAIFFDVLYIIYAYKERQLNPDIDAKFIELKNVYLKKLKVFLMGEKQYQKKRKYKKKQKIKKTHRKK